MSKENPKPLVQDVLYETGRWGIVTMRIVFLESRARGRSSGLHSLYNEIILFPPAGYKYVVPKQSAIPNQQDKIGQLNKRFPTQGIVKTIYDYVRPLAYCFYNSLRDRSPLEKADLTYASQHLVFRKEPWVVDLEHAGALALYGKVKLVRGVIEKALGSSYCKKILPWTEMSKKTLLASVDCRNIEKKIEVVRLAVRPKKFRKMHNRDTLKLLFVGTGNPVNVGSSFAIKGGNEVLMAFMKLRNEYRNLELVLRSHVPADARKKYADFKNIRIIDEIVPWKLLDYEFRTSEIFLFPSHSTPGMAILDAMSYELPVVTTNVWANSELVDDGRTGFLIKGHSGVCYYDAKFLPCWGEPKFMTTISQADPKMVEDLVNKTRILIEDEKLRRKMGEAGRKEVEEGKFSIITRNRKLKKIYDEAIEVS
jgi:glycosyltransferase involved in cell wall biosynthesis